MLNETDKILSQLIVQCIRPAWWRIFLSIKLFILLVIWRARQWGCGMVWGWRRTSLAPPIAIGRTHRPYPLPITRVCAILAALSAPILNAWCT